MDPLRFLALARRLSVTANEEEWRTAISRAYYAAFHVACALLTDLGFTVPKADRAHGYLWLRLQNCGDLPTEKAGGDLKAMRSLRNWADYDLHKTVPAARAASAVLWAESIIQALDAAAVEPVRSQITNAMKVYEQNVLHDVTWHP
jgi:uncharacterized protein (UPF0332 family)